MGPNDFTSLGVKLLNFVTFELYCGGRGDLPHMGHGLPMRTYTR